MLEKFRANVLYSNKENQLKHQGCYDKTVVSEARTIYTLFIYNQGPSCI